MLLDLSEQSSETLQQQIVRQVRSRILTGELEADAALPSIRGLARQVRVSVITVERAYDQLVGQGLIASRRGKGFFVSDLTPTQRTTLARQRSEDWLEQLVTRALDDGLTPDDIRQLLEAILAQR